MRFALPLLLVLVACKSTPKATPAPEGPSDAATKMQVVVYDASPVVVDAGRNAAYDSGAGEHDFEDMFVYGGADALDAGPDDPTALKKTQKYELYANPRFHFTVDIPTSFVAMEEPMNGDGRQWRVGKLAVITASGIDNLGEPLVCPSSKNVTAHRNGKNSCWVTGKKDGFIHWEHIVRNGGEDHSLRFQYAESLKEVMDPIVKHVSSSWSQ